MAMSPLVMGARSLSPRPWPNAGAALARSPAPAAATPTPKTPFFKKERRFARCLMPLPDFFIVFSLEFSEFSIFLTTELSRTDFTDPFRTQPDPPRPPDGPPTPNPNVWPLAWRQIRDRKSTRLNSSHTVTSYAVFCLKKKRTESLAQYLPSR